MLKRVLPTPPQQLYFLVWNISGQVETTLQSSFVFPRQLSALPYHPCESGNYVWDDFQTKEWSWTSNNPAYDIWWRNLFGFMSVNDSLQLKAHIALSAGRCSRYSASSLLSGPWMRKMCFKTPFFHQQGLVVNCFKVFFSSKQIIRCKTQTVPCSTWAENDILAMFSNVCCAQACAAFFAETMSNIVCILNDYKDAICFLVTHHYDPCNVSIRAWIIPNSR